jgi:hypothetical protein
MKNNKKYGVLLLWSLVSMATYNVESLLAVEEKDLSANWLKAIETMKSYGRYTGSFKSGVDTSTLSNKIVCGYQGWHNAEGDGADIGWTHYRFTKGFAPGSTCVDYWPDVSELDADEKFATSFRKEDGSVAYVPSSFVKKTGIRHCKWMEDYGLDALFIQRFAGPSIRDANLFNHNNTVLRNIREGCNLYGRAYVVMYDLSGLEADKLESLKLDWMRLVDNMGVTRDAGDHAYLHHRGKPLVAVWGIGFGSGKEETKGKRAFSLDSQREFLNFLKNDPKYGGCSLMIGIPTAWRTQTRDATSDPKLLEICKEVDVLSPWTVGRYKTIEEVSAHAKNYYEGDVAWCKENNLDFLPVVFPGFSWHNKTPAKKMDEIPRQGGKFLWSQYAALKKLGIPMVYQAMFDEMDEGTQIFKVDQNPPVGESPFLTYEGQANDYYLWLVGQAKKMIVGELPFTDLMPTRK